MQTFDAYRRSQRLFLQEAITFTSVKKEKTRKTLSKLEVDLRSVMGFVDWIHVLDNFIRCNIENIGKVKLSELMGSKLHHNPNKIIHHFSSYQLSEVEQSLLCKGLNFALPPKKLKFENYLLPFEFLFTNIYHENQRNESILHLKSKIKDVVLSSFRLYNKKDHCFENLSEEEYQAFLSLSKNNGIIIQKADKGNTVVLLNKSSYIKEMEELLADTSKFVKAEFNKKDKVNQELRHLLDLEGNIKTYLDNLLQKHYISKEDYNFLKPCRSRPGIM